jgi:hypothetical protein
MLVDEWSRGGRVDACRRRVLNAHFTHPRDLCVSRYSVRLLGFRSSPGVFSSSAEPAEVMASAMTCCGVSLSLRAHAAASSTVQRRVRHAGPPHAPAWKPASSTRSAATPCPVVAATQSHQFAGTRLQPSVRRCVLRTRSSTGSVRAAVGSVSVRVSDTPCRIGAGTGLLPRRRCARGLCHRRRQPAGLRSQGPGGGTLAGIAQPASLPSSDAFH